MCVYGVASCGESDFLSGRCPPHHLIITLYFNQQFFGTNNDLTRGGVDVPTVLGMRAHAAGVTDLEGECEGRAE